MALSSARPEDLRTYRRRRGTMTTRQQMSPWHVLCLLPTGAYPVMTLCGYRVYVKDHEWESLRTESDVFKDDEQVDCERCLRVVYRDFLGNEVDLEENG